MRAVFIKKHQWLSLLLLVGSLFLAWEIYSQAENLTWQFDDFLNLKLLSHVSNHTGLIDFAFGGIAGPLGRPISLLTFLPNYADWSGNPWGVVQLNLVLHCLNALLVYLIAVRIFCEEKAIGANQAYWLAAICAAIWVIAPINASGVLMPIQRMTIVSAFFVLAGIWLYLVIRQKHLQIPSFYGLIYLAVGVLIFCALAIYSKENGVVILGLIGLLEGVIFRQRWENSVHQQKWKILIGVTIMLVPFALAYHVLSGWKGINVHFNNYRGYSFAENIGTQLVISWEYIRQIIIPRSALMGPFHDNHPVFGWSDFEVYAALGGWLALMYAAMLCWKNKTNPEVKVFGKYLFFAIAWYWVAQQVESTVIPLELYFEHRNYIPAVGVFVFVMVSLFLAFSKLKSKALVFLLGVFFVGLQVFNLQQLTSVWGRPSVAYELWFKHQPNSTRALQALAGSYLGTGREWEADIVINNFIDERRAADVAIQFFDIFCAKASPETAQNRLNSILEMAEKMQAPAGLTTGLAKMGGSIRAGRCTAVDLETYGQFLQKMLALPKVKSNNRIRHHFEYEIAVTALSMNDVENYEKYAKMAFVDFPSYSVANAIVLILAQNGRVEDAVKWIDQFPAYAANRMQREAWMEQSKSIRQALLDVHRQILEFQMQTQFESEGAK